MMGLQGSSQDRLFYSFNLDDHVPQNHLLRGINQFLDLSELRRHLAAFYSHTGRPSIDPELMIRILIVGYCFGIRSERRLCDEVHLNLAYRWFCRLGLEDAAMFAASAMAAPLVLCGVPKIAYDLALFAAFRRVEHDLVKEGA
jgi:transposase